MRATMIAVLALAAAHLFAQAGYVKAYYISEKGDTVRGDARVNPKKEFDNYYKISFRDEKGQQKTFKPEKIKGYGYNDTIHYVSITEDGEALFYKVLARGEITLYKFMYEGIKMNKPIFVPEYYMSVPGKKELVLVKENKFKKQMGEWMDDYPALVEQYPDHGEFDVRDATQLVNNYNAWKAHKK